MENTCIGVAFSPADLTALITWSEDAAKWGVASDIAADEAEGIAENLLVTLSGSNEPAFSLWTKSSGAYCLEDWRRLGWDDAGVSSHYPTLEAALHKIESAMVKHGHALPRVTV